MSLPQNTVPATVELNPSGNASLRGEQWRRILRRLGPYASLIALISISIFIGLREPRFFQTSNWVRISVQSASVLVLALGSTFVIILGSIDLSVEGLLALSSVIISLLVLNDKNDSNLGVIGLIIPLAACGLMGFLNGFLHTRLRIPSFMTTLGMLSVGLGLATVLYAGVTARIKDPYVRGLALDDFLGLPWVVWIAIVSLAIAYFIQRYTRIGRYMYAIGGAEDLATLSGVPVNRYKVIIFTLAGVFSGLGGLIMAAQLGTGTAVIGEGRLFTAITAVVVGGTSLSGGEGGVLNTLVGVLLVVVLSNGMILLGVTPYIQQAIQGLIILVAVALTINRSRLKIIK